MVLRLTLCAELSSPECLVGHMYKHTMENHSPRLGANAVPDLESCGRLLANGGDAKGAKIRVRRSAYSTTRKCFSKIRTAFGFGFPFDVRVFISGGNTWASCRPLS